MALPHILTALSLSAVLLTGASAHGLMCTPRQRAAYAASDKCGSSLPVPKEPVVDFCPHCLNGGTVETVSKNMPRDGWKVYDPIGDFRGTADRAGLCGDPKGEDAHMVGGSFMPYDSIPMVENYKKGARVDFKAEIDTNHNGYFEFFLCNLDACGEKDISGKCFMEGHCHKLLRVPHPDCENTDVDTHYECGPIDPKYPGRWYLPCRKTGHVGVHVVGGDKGTMRYKLPDNVECKHCVIQWYWATANSCAPRGFLDYFEAFNEPFGNTCGSDGGGRGAYRPGMEQCGGDFAPEEFWSCADVQITKDGNAAGEVAAVGEPNSDSMDNAPVEEEAPESPPPSPSPMTSPSPESITTDNSGESADTEEMPSPTPSASPVSVTTDTPDGSSDSNDSDVSSKVGECVRANATCDGSVPCCNMKQVCVYSDEAGGFTCRYWRNLWKDVQKRQKSM